MTGVLEDVTAAGLGALSDPAYDTHEDNEAQSNKPASFHTLRHVIALSRREPPRALRARCHRLLMLSLL